jgi:hypothetical protein
MVVVLRIAFFRSLSHLHCCNCCNMYMVIGSWASLHTHIRAKKRKKEKRKKERKRKKMVDSDAAAVV